MQHNLTVIYNKTGYKLVITIQNLINVICYYCKPKIPLIKGDFLLFYIILLSRNKESNIKRHSVNTMVLFTTSYMGNYGFLDKE